MRNDDNEADEDEEKDTSVDESCSAAPTTPTHQSNTSLLKLVPIPTDPTVYANLGNSRTSLAPTKPQRSGLSEEGPSKSQNSFDQDKVSAGDVPTLNMFHAKTSSITGSIHSETLSDSSMSCPSSGPRKNTDGSEADSERDSVSPQRMIEPEVRIRFFVNNQKY